MTLLEVSGLCKHYAGFDLKDVQLSVEKGEILGLIGRNGAGKSTAILDPHGTSRCGGCAVFWPSL